MSASGAPRSAPGLFSGSAPFGVPTRVELVGGIRYFVGELWTSRQRQAHRIQEISYRTCFKPQLPAFFIERLTAPGDIVHDPFMGRGTTPIEAALRGRIPYGNDVNPLSRTFTEPRVNTPDLSRIADRLRRIPWSGFTRHRRDDLLAFYHPETLAQIEGLRSWLLRRRRDGELDPVDRWIEMVAVNRLTGHSSGFLSAYTLPPNQAVSVAGQRKINEKRGQVPPPKSVPAVVLKKSGSLLAHGPVRAQASRFLTKQSHDTPEIPDGSVALTVTSPPFLDIVNYEADNWLRGWFLGIDPGTVKTTKLRRVEDWRAFVRATLVELARITRPGGHVAFEVGEVRQGAVRLDEHVIEAARGLPFDIPGVLINEQSFTKTSNCWGVANNTRGTNTNRIVLLRRHHQQPVEKVPRIRTAPGREPESTTIRRCGALFHGQAGRIASAIRPTVSRGEGKPSPHPLPGGAPRRVGTRGTFTTACQRRRGR